ncbi:MAG: ComEC/Rec2 family competence protein [Oligosphaeraceae bacterium]|nr:ComEC/Rec2 family competence protein [Oligosphaeraceae bacterium]
MFRPSLRNFRICAPSFVYFCCFAAGAYAAIAPGAFYRRFCAVPLILLAGHLSGQSLYTSCSNLFLFAAAFCWCVYFSGSPRQNYLRRMPREECWAKLQLRITEKSAIPPELADLKIGQRYCVQIIAMQTHIETNWQATRGKLLLQAAPDKLAELEELRIGDLLVLEGCLLLPPGENEAAAYYGRHLKIQGYRRILLVSKIHSTMRVDGGVLLYCQRAIQRLRGFLALRMAAGLDDADSLRALLALSLGMYELLSPAIKQDFIRSGTIHIFSISGLHVGMVILLLERFLRLCGCKLKTRWFCLPLFLLGYLLLTGCSTSALRAFNMSLFFIYSSMRFRVPNALNALGLSGLITLAGNPLYIMHSGFIYSYLIVIVLILSWQPMQQVKMILLEKQRWIPRKYQSRISLERAGANLAAALGSSCMAWAASAGITLEINGILCLLSPLINLPLGTNVFLVLAFCPLKLLLDLLPGAAVFSALTMQTLLKSLLFLAESGAASAMTLRTQPFSRSQTLLYYACLTVCLLIMHSKSLLLQNEEDEKK